MNTLYCRRLSLKTNFKCFIITESYKLEIFYNFYNSFSNVNLTSRTIGNFSILAMNSFIVFPVSSGCVAGNYEELKIVIRKLFLIEKKFS